MILAAFGSVDLWIIWIIICVIAIIIESVSQEFLSIWFAAGAAVCTVIDVAFPSLPFYWQFALFALLSAGFLIATRPLVKKMMDRNKIATNVDALIGSTAIVTKQISNYQIGEVTVEPKFGAIIWLAISNDNTTIECGEEVIITQITGVKLIVQRKKTSKEE